jgi:hypothetical protein
MIEVLLPPTTLNDLEKIANGATAGFTLRSNIDVSNAREVSVLVRAYGISFTAAGGGAGPSLSLFLQPVAPQGDGKVWGVSAAVVTVPICTAAAPTEGVYMGSNVTNGLLTPVGGLVNLVFSYTQYANGATNTDITISADIVRKA